jgi:hypothetical protein
LRTGVVAVLRCKIQKSGPLGRLEFLNDLLESLHDSAPREIDIGSFQI